MPAQDLSIIIPFYKGEKHIIKLLKSIYDALNLLQTPLSSELIILIDSVETEATELEKLISQHLTVEFISLIKFIKNSENIGVAATRNKGLKLANGTHILCIDQDDQMSEKYFITIQPLLKEKDFILTNGLLKYTNGKVCKLYYLPPSLSLTNLLLDDFIKTPGQVIFQQGDF